MYEFKDGDGILVANKYEYEKYEKLKQKYINL